MQTAKKQKIAKLDIMRNCPTCKGYGCKDCATAVEKINVMSGAGIPVKYWTYTLDTFVGDEKYKSKLVSHIGNIEQIYADGSTIIFTGPVGVGKTFGACELLKSGFANGLTGRYTTLTELIDTILHKAEGYKFKAELLSCDLLVIDEVDSRHIANTENAQNVFGTNLEYILRTRIQNKLPIILCSNNDDLGEIFDGMFKQVFTSLLSSNVIRIAAYGKDLRK